MPADQPRYPTLANVHYALTFATVLPLGPAPMRPPVPQDIYAMSILGWLLGMMAVIGAAVGQMLGLPALVMGALLIVADVAVTGGLHLDGIGDIGDALAAKRAGRSREAIDAALKDPRIGGVGAAWLIGVMVLRWALVAHILGTMPLLAIAVAPIISRAGIPLLLRAIPARPHGLGATFKRATTSQSVVLSLVTGWIGVLACTQSLLLPSLLVLVPSAIVVWVIGRVTSAIDVSSGDAIGLGVVSLEVLVMLGLTIAG